jgi:hypothetical protein
MAPDSTVRGSEHFVPRPSWYFTFLHAGRHFRNFPELLAWKEKKEFENPPVVTGTFCPSPILAFYIPPCRKTFPEWRNVTNRGFFIPRTTIFQRRA